MLLWGVAARAGDCPTGETFSARFAACVQADCNDVEHAHYAHGGECVCSSAGSIAQKDTDPTKPCRRPRAYASCPGCVYKCVRPDQSCPTDVQVDPQAKCEKTCAEYHSPGVRGELVGGECRCVCKPGYEPDDTLTCKKVSPQKACENSCAEYHSRGVRGELVGGECRCVCKPGYEPDETLTCKRRSCEDLCRERLGEHGVPGEAPHPDCGCTCDSAFEERGGRCEPKKRPLTCPRNAEPDSSNERCRCRHPFRPEPVDGECVVDELANCGDGFCDLLGRNQLLFEDCAVCPADCGCPDDQTFCAPRIGKESAARCRKEAAKLLDWGCAKGEAHISVTRDKYDVPVTRGMSLTPGDEVTFMVLDCGGGFAEFKWGGAKGRVVYPEHSPSIFHTIRIGDGAVASGWPLLKDRRAQGIAEVFWYVAREEGLPRAVALVLSSLSFPVSFGAGASSLGGAPVHVWIKSELLIVQRSDETARVFTQSGRPSVQLGDGPKQAVPPGRFVDVSPTEQGTVRTVTPSDIDALEASGIRWCVEGRRRVGLECSEGGGELPRRLAYFGIALMALSGLLLAYAASRRA